MMAAYPPPFRVRPSIICFGDSITQFGYGKVESDYIGWVSLLSAAYTRRCDVLNRGYSGYNTRDAIRLLPHIFHQQSNSFVTNKNTKEEKPVVVDDIHQASIHFCTIFFGANDATIPGSDQHVPIEEY